MSKWIDKISIKWSPVTLNKYLYCRYAIMFTGKFYNFYI